MAEGRVFPCPAHCQTALGWLRFGEGQGRGVKGAGVRGGGLGCWGDVALGWPSVNEIIKPLFYPPLIKHEAKLEPLFVCHRRE